MFRKEMQHLEYRLSSVTMTPCETLRASGKKVRYAAPEAFDKLCSRQGSWYRNSNKFGEYLVISEEKLPQKYNRFLNASISESDFMPGALPEKKAIKQLVNSLEYRSQRPDEWEQAGIKDSVMFKLMFSITGFWGWGDNMKKHWINQRANHANFLSHQYTSEIDGEDVPYSVTDNDGVCSSCVEFFNMIDQSSRKMVRACPGAVTFAGVKGKVYYDVNPVRYVALEDVV